MNLMIVLEKSAKDYFAEKLFFMAKEKNLILCMSGSSGFGSDESIDEVLTYEDYLRSKCMPDLIEIEEERKGFWKFLGKKIVSVARIHSFENGTVHIQFENSEKSEEYFWIAPEIEKISTKVILA